MNPPFRTAAVLTLASLSLAASAVSMRYTLSGTASGTLNGIAFTNAAFSIAATGNTADVTLSSSYPANVYRIFPVTTTVTVAGIGSDTLTDSIQVVANQGNPSVGFGDITLNSGIAFDNDPAFQNYDLRSAIGPITSVGSYSPNVPYPTTGGTFLLSDMPTAKFQARAVPEPASLAALVLGACGLLRRRKRA